ncbi:MAG: aerobic carbon-monoxide dehydrogenase medium subunit [Thermoleophilaceae bacterium]|nr:aerobic carbon-monoxide dehydrogenase medium subunit [Thermoleophilaceae bacterium]
MKPPRFDYSRPSTLARAVELLAASDGEGKLLAGGQSLVPVLNMRLAQPSVLVDLGLVEELRGLRREGDVLSIGAGVRQCDAEKSPLVRDCCPLVPQALRHVGHVQIRNRGTIGGSIAHADPTAELPAVALALDAELVATSVRGTRTIAARDFFRGPYTTTLEEDEVLTQVRLPIFADARTAFHEVARRSGDFALAALAAVVRFAPGSQTIVEARLAAVGTGGTPVRLDQAETGLEGRELTPETVDAAAADARAQLDATADQTVEREFRRDLVGTLVSRALTEVRP